MTMAFARSPRSRVVAQTRRTVTLALLTGCSAIAQTPPHAAPATAALPKVLVIATGGTIAGVQDAPAPPMVTAQHLTPAKARILLMVALTRTKDPREIQQLFQRY